MEISTLSYLVYCLRDGSVTAFKAVKLRFKSFTNDD